MTDLASTVGGVRESTQVLTAMLRGLGIRAILEDGVASTHWVSSWTFWKVDTLQVDHQNHAWVDVEGIAPGPVATDPTWDGGSPRWLFLARVLVNDYTTTTHLFAATHHPTGPDVGGAVLP